MPAPCRLSAAGPAPRSRLTRLLHAAIALAIIAQLIGIGFAELPRPGLPGNLAFSAHQVVGLGTLSVLAVFWIWTLLRRREHGFTALMPWFSRGRRAAVWADLREHVAVLRRLRLPEPGRETPLASAVHGLGLVIATIMAATGAIVFAGMAPDGALSAWADAALSVHKAAANLMWAYLIGHPAVALLHEAIGHRLLRGMTPGLR